MNIKEKISSFTLSTVILSLSAMSFFGIFSSYIINKTMNASIISTIIGFILSLLISHIILKFININSNLTFTQNVNKLFPKLGKIINTLTIISSLSAYILITYRLSTFLSNNYLINTPKYLISLLTLILTFYISIKGTNALIRISYITFFITIINFLFDAINLIPQINIDNYIPLIDTNIKQILTSSIIFALYFSIPIIYINVVPLNICQNKNDFKKNYYIMITLSFIIIITSIITCIGVSSSKLLGLFDYPIYSSLKKIKLFNTIDSLENISISSWFLFIINTSSLMLIHIFSSIKETFNKDSIIIKAMIILITFIISYIINNSNYNETYNYIYIPLIPCIFTLFILIISIIKKLLIQK